MSVQITQAEIDTLVGNITSAKAAEVLPGAGVLLSGVKYMTTKVDLPPAGRTVHGRKVRNCDIRESSTSNL